MFPNKFRAGILHFVVCIHETFGFWRGTSRWTSIAETRHLHLQTLEQWKWGAEKSLHNLIFGTCRISPSCATVTAEEQAWVVAALFRNPKPKTSWLRAKNVVNPTLHHFAIVPLQIRWLRKTSRHHGWTICGISRTTLHTAGRKHCTSCDIEQTSFLLQGWIISSHASKACSWIGQAVSLRSFFGLIHWTFARNQTMLHMLGS